MLNFDQIVMAIMIKALDFLFGQIGEWFEERRMKRKRRRKSKARLMSHHLEPHPAYRRPKANSH